MDQKFFRRAKVMIRKFFALLLMILFAANIFSVVEAKSPEEKAAAKEAKVQKKMSAQVLKAHKKQNILSVIAWADKDDIQAQMILSYATRTGQRVRRNKKHAAELEDKVKAVNPELVEKFIPLEYGKKKVSLSRLYGLAACRSQIGQYVDMNFDDAVRWARLGVSEEDTLSMAVLGSAYYTGRGVRQDYKKAIELLMQARNEPIALYLLSDAYAKGKGVDKDLEQSKFYADYLAMIQQPKIDKKREKNAKKLEKEKAKEQKAKDKETEK